MLIDKYYIWGAGTYGERLIKFFQDDLEFEAVIDNDTKKQGTKFHGLPVISYDEAKKNIPTIKVVLAINVPAKAQSYLLDEGFRKDKDFYTMHSFIPRYYWEKNKSIVIKAADIAVTTKCNMNCEGCLAYIPIAKKHNNISADITINDIDLMFNHIDRVLHMNICVGESLLNNKLPEVLHHVSQNYKDRYSYMSVQSNGSILPDDDIMRCLSETKTLLVVSNYPENKTGTAKILEKCKKFNVNWLFNSQGGDRENWLDYGDPRTMRSDNLEELIKLFARCWQPGMALYNNHLYMCVTQAWSHLVAEVGTLEAGDAFDLSQQKTDETREKLYKIVSRQPPDNGYISHCARCNGAMTPLMK